MTTTTAATLQEALAASPLAQDLTPDQLPVLAARMTDVHHAAGAVLAREGTSDSKLYVIVEGSLSIIKAHGTPDQALLVSLATNDLAHELGFLDGAERYASLVARSPLRVLVLERDALESLVDTHPRIAFNVMRTIVRKVHRVQRELSVQASELTNYIVKQHGRY